MNFTQIKFRWLTILCALLMMSSLASPARADAGPGRCTGSFVNPITDICWSCLFPISVGGLKIWPSSRPDPKIPSVRYACAAFVPVSPWAFGSR